MNKKLKNFFEVWKLAWGSAAAAIVALAILFYGAQAAKSGYDYVQHNMDVRAAAELAEQQQNCQEAAVVTGLTSRFVDNQCQVFVEEVGNRGGFWISLSFYELSKTGG